MELILFPQILLSGMSPPDETIFHLFDVKLSPSLKIELWKMEKEDYNNA